MKSILESILLSSIAFSLLTGCNKKSKDYYASGYDIKDYYASGYDIFVAGGNVYVAGCVNDGTSLTDVPTLWVNGEAQSIGDMGNFNKATSVFVDGEDVYVTITDFDKSKALLWKNGSVQQLDGEEANSVAVAEDKVYVVGSSKDKPTLWTNGILEWLSDNGGSAESIFLDGDDIYVVGYTGSYWAGNATIWINGVEHIVSYENSLANDVVVSDNKIYIAGKDPISAILWVGTIEDNDFNLLEDESQRLGYAKSVAYSVAVSDGTVFSTGIRGFNDGRPEYGAWKNGHLLHITDDRCDQISAVKINDDRVYFSGSRKNAEPLWTINFNK